MKKIISFVLAALLLVSAVPMAHATNDYTAGTKVEYTAANTEAYTITVPAQLAPGGSGTVTLEGTWASDRVVSVTADKNVKLINSIKAADQKTLDVSFPGIDEYGSNTTCQIFTETVSVANITDALFGTWSGRFYYNVNVYDSVEYLQSKYDFEYYSTMNLAVTDVNNSAIGASADIDEADKDTAVAGIYTDEYGGVNVVLLKDTTEATRIKPSADMTINLGGHTLSSEDNTVIDIFSGDVTIDGRLNGSTVESTNTATAAPRAIQARSGKVLLNGGTYTANTDLEDMAAVSIMSAANLTVSNATVVASGTNELVHGFEILGGTTTVSNCDIMATANDGRPMGIYIETTAETVTVSNCNIKVTVSDGKGYGVYNGSTATISDCNIKAYSNYTYNKGEGEDYYGALSVGVSNSGTLTLNDCSVMGTHSGVYSPGPLYVNGGTYEGPGHGGFYFSGSGNTAYVNNAIIRQCAMPDGYTATAEFNDSGFYIGGSDNITVYMDNCDIYGSSQTIVLRDTSGERNNSLYISNSTISGAMNIRIDNNTHKLYIGTGNNFTADNANRTSAVVVTDETYIYNG